MAITKEKSLLILILLSAALLRCGLLWVGLQNSDSLYTPDSKGYCSLADGLVERGNFQIDGKAVIFRTPGYPVFLMLRKIIPPAGVLGVQVAVDVSVVFMTFLLGAWLVNNRAGLWGAMFYAISPLAMATCCRFLSESMYLFFFMLAVLLMVKHLRGCNSKKSSQAKSSYGKSSYVTLICSAVALAIACYVRPVGQVMIVLFMLALLFRPKRLVRLSLFAGIIILCLGPWIIRNAVQADYMGFSSFAGDSMYNTTAADIIAKKQNLPAEEIREIFYTEADKYKAGPPERTIGEVSRWRQQEALKIIRENPKLWLRGYLKGCLGFWLPGANYVLELLGLSQGQRGTVDVLQRQGLFAAMKHYFGSNFWAIALALPMILIMLVKYLGLVICIVRKAGLRMPLEVWLLVGIVAATAFLPGPGLPRYRLPIEPIIAIATAAGWMLRRNDGVRNLNSESMTNVQ